MLVKTDGSFAALLVTVTEARRQESDEWRPLLPGHDSQGMKSQITTNCTGGNTNCAVCSKHQEPLPSGSVSVLLRLVLLCAQVGDWKMVGFEE